MAAVIDTAPPSCACAAEVEARGDARAEELLQRLRDRGKKVEAEEPGTRARDVNELLQLFRATSSPRLRVEILRALNDPSVFSIPEYPSQLTFRLKKIAKDASQDPAFKVRYAAGRLSRSLDHWVRELSPSAVDAGRRKERGRDVQVAIGWILVLLAALFLFLVLIGRAVS